jgi:predicted DNA-binding transcriptional regulator YafY
MTIAAACRDAERLRFAYRSRDGTQTRREVEPHALVNRGRRWYLVAWDRGRDDWRTFRVDRLRRLAPAGGRCPARVLPATDPAAFVEQSIAGTAHRYQARVTVHVAAADLTARFPWTASAVTAIDASSCEYRTEDDDLDWLAIRVVMLGADVEVHEPPELVAALRLVAARLQRAVGTAG